MSKIKLTGHASGTGVLEITAPNTSTDRTITLPDTTGTLLDENSSVPAANLTGTVADARFPATLPAASAANLTAIPAANITGTLPAISGANLTGLPAQGITHYSVWLLTSNLGLNNSSSFATITSNLSESGQPSYTRIGAAMTESGGIFTFPATGIWWVEGSINAGGGAGYARAELQATTNNSSYAEVQRSADEVGSNGYSHMTVSGLIDVTNTSNVKVRFMQGGTAGRFQGGTSPPETTFSFTRIGDT